MRYLFLLLILASSVDSLASHIASAEIRYEYTGIGNKYRFYLTAIKSCEPNNAALVIGYPVTFRSGNTTFNRDLYLWHGPDTIANYCPGFSSSCSQPASIYPGFEKRIYSDTVTLNPNTWTIMWKLCCRPASIVNLTTPDLFDNYVEAVLDNSNTINSSAWLPNPNPLWVVQGTPVTFSLNAIDPENDSIAYEWFQPLTYGNFTTPSVPIPYTAGYSLSSPLGVGGSLTINSNNTVTIMAPAAGKYSLGIRVKEYRNGQLVGATMRDFTLVSLSSSISYTPPLAATANVSNYTTCPGASNSITLNFTDPDPTDSVYLTVTTPNFPTWTFNTTVSPGLGGASATISWQTPLFMNPATLTGFYINVLAKDNSCPAQAYSYYSVAVQTAQCNTDSVWAGDANGDYTVNIYDPLAVAVAYGKTGPARPGASTVWQAQHCPIWNDSFMNGVSMKHADCNGDGVVNSADLPAISSNWALVHQKGGPKSKTAGVPELYFDIAGINFYPGATVSVPVKLGTSANVASNVYGVGAVITVNGITLGAPPTMSYPTSWLGSTSNTLNFIKNINTSSIGWAYARSDHQNISGQGTIGFVNFTIPATAIVGETINFRFSEAAVVDNNLGSVPFTDMDTMVLIKPLGVEDIATRIFNAAIIPNPSANGTKLKFALPEQQNLSVSIIDNVGRVVHEMKIVGQKGDNAVNLPSEGLAAGVYALVLKTSGSGRVILKWIRQ